MIDISITSVALFSTTCHAYPKSYVSIGNLSIIGTFQGYHISEIISPFQYYLYKGGYLMFNKSLLHQARLNEWASRCADQKASGLSVTDWCEQNNLSKHKFFYWKQLLKNLRRLTTTLRG